MFNPKATVAHKMLSRLIVSTNPHVRFISMQILLTELSELSLYQPVKGLNSYNTDAFIRCCDWYVMYDKVSLLFVVCCAGMCMIAVG